MVGNIDGSSLGVIDGNDDGSLLLVGVFEGLLLGYFVVVVDGYDVGILDG